MKAPPEKRYDLSQLSLEQLRALSDLQRTAEVNDAIDVVPVDEEGEE